MVAISLLRKLKKKHSILFEKNINNLVI